MPVFSNSFCFFGFHLAYRVTAIADKLGIEFALIHRQRVNKNQDSPEKMDVLVGDVRDKVRLIHLWTAAGSLTVGSQVAILVDDMIDSGNTLSLAARTLHENGAKTIYALVSHGMLDPETVIHTLINVAWRIGLLSELNMSKIEELPIEQLVVRLSFF